MCNRLQLYLCAQGASENELKALDSVLAFVERKQSRGSRLYSVFHASAVIFARCYSLPTSNEVPIEGMGMLYRACIKPNFTLSELHIWQISSYLAYLHSANFAFSEQKFGDGASSLNANLTVSPFRSYRGNALVAS